jgi:CTP synthase (UTP-ammonia lyase)
MQLEGARKDWGKYPRSEIHMHSFMRANNVPILAVCALEAVRQAAIGSANRNPRHSPHNSRCGGENYDFGTRCTRQSKLRSGIQSAAIRERLRGRYFGFHEEVANRVERKGNVIEASERDVSNRVRFSSPGPCFQTQPGLTPLLRLLRFLSTISKSGITSGLNPV